MHIMIQITTLIKNVVCYEQLDPSCNVRKRHKRFPIEFLLQTYFILECDHHHILKYILHKKKTNSICSHAQNHAL